MGGWEASDERRKKKPKFNCATGMGGDTEDPLFHFSVVCQCHCLCL